ncbi:MAG: zinc ribbon domain-containing protein [Deltaproteobacteria bacterium]
MLITSIGACIILLASLFIAWPLLAPARSATTAAAAPTSGGKEAIHILETQRDQALAALREARLDHATGKWSDEDYNTMRAELEGRALDAITTLDATAAPTPPSTCTACAHPCPPQARFCGVCGQSQ